PPELTMRWNEEADVMNLTRRRFLQFAASAAALPVTRIARAQESYPTRPVRLLVGYAAGGPADTVARLPAQWLSERLRHTGVRGKSGRCGQQYRRRGSCERASRWLHAPLRYDL